MKRGKGRRRAGVEQEGAPGSFFPFFHSAAAHTPSPHFRSTQDTGKICSQPKPSREAHGSIPCLPSDFAAPSEAE